MEVQFLFAGRGALLGRMAFRWEGVRRRGDGKSKGHGKLSRREVLVCMGSPRIVIWCMSSVIGGRLVRNIRMNIRLTEAHVCNRYQAKQLMSWDGSRQAHCLESGNMFNLLSKKYYGIRCVQACSHSRRYHNYAM